MNYGVKVIASFLLISIAIFSYAGYLDDWTDDQICGWMDNPSPPEHMVEEAVKRNLDCAPESAKKKAQEDTGLQIMVYDADFSDSDKASLSLNDMNNSQSDEGTDIGIYIIGQTTETVKTAIVLTSDNDPKVSKVIEVIQGDKFIVDIAEPHELAGSNIKLLLLDIDAPDATKSCPKQMEYGLKVKDFVSQKLKGASSIKLTNFRKTNTSVVADVIVDGTDLGEELKAKGYADSEHGVWKAYFCSAGSAERFAKKYEWHYPNLNKHIFWRERLITLDPDNVERNARATYTLSQLYFEAGDINKSLDYLKKSATWGWLEPLEELGELLLYGQNYFGINIPINTIEGKKLLKKAHDKGSKSAELIYCSSLTEDQQKTCKF